MLALDTSGDVCSVAVLRGGELLAEHTFRHEMRLSEHLMSHLTGVLAEAGAALDGIGLFAVGIGPGSFTGTRIGLMTVKTLAWIGQRPVYGINSLAALALELSGSSEWIVPVLPCRAGVVFGAVYCVADGTPNLQLEPAAWPITDLIERMRMLDAGGVVVCGVAATTISAEFNVALRDSRQVRVGISRFPRAALVGSAAWARYSAGDRGDDAINLVPEYLAPPPISLPRPGNTGVRADHLTR